MDHGRRMELAREITDYLRRNHEGVLAVILEGSTAKGEDREHSDLEMTVITKTLSETKCYQCIFEGIVIEAVFGTEEESVRNASTVNARWPTYADGWTGSVALFDSEGLLPKLAALVSNPDPERVREEMGGILVSIYEDVCKVRNHVASGETQMARFVCPFLAEQVARFLAFLNRQHFNGTRNLLTKPRDFSQLPPHFWEDYPALLAVEDAAEGLLVRAERMYRECQDLWRAAGNDAPPPKTLEEALDRGRTLRAG